MSSLFNKLISRAGQRNLSLWAFPLAGTAGWVLWPALDLEWKVSLGLASDPEGDVKYVENLRVMRMEAAKQAKGVMDDVDAVKEKVAVLVEEEEEEEEVEEEAPVEEEEEEDAAPAPEEEEEESGDDAEEEEEEEAEEGPRKELYEYVKGSKENEVIWDNFALKSVRMGEDDDDDDDDEGE